MTRPLAVLCSIIASGLRHVALPSELPIKVSIVLEYTETTVRHEFETNLAKVERLEVPEHE